AGSSERQPPRTPRTGRGQTRGYLLTEGIASELEKRSSQGREVRLVLTERGRAEQAGGSGRPPGLASLRGTSFPVPKQSPPPRSTRERRGCRTASELGSGSGF